MQTTTYECPHCRDGCWHCAWKQPQESIVRGNDGRISERQDRPGYSKNWTYTTEGKHPTSGQWIPFHSGIKRLDQAIQITLDIPGIVVSDIRIIQVTTTNVWQRSADAIQPIGDDINLFDNS